MCGGKPTVPENLMGTSTFSDYDSAHTSKFTNFSSIPCAAATLETLNPFQFVNYIHIIDFSSNLLKAFFYSGIISIRYSMILKSLLFTMYLQGSYLSLRILS